MHFFYFGKTYSQRLINYLHVQKEICIPRNIKCLIDRTLEPWITLIPYRLYRDFLKFFSFDFYFCNKKNWIRARNNAKKILEYCEI